MRLLRGKISGRVGRGIEPPTSAGQKTRYHEYFHIIKKQHALTLKQRRMWMLVRLALNSCFSMLGVLSQWGQTDRDWGGVKKVKARYRLLRHPYIGG